MSPLASNGKKKGIKSKESKHSTKELIEKIDILNIEINSIKDENKALKERLRLICNKILSNADLSTYKFLENTINYENISTQDYLHMIQNLSLQNVDAREYLKSNLYKSNDRIEFVLQERDVWKRNYDTLRRIYEKISKFFKNFLKKNVFLSLSFSVKNCNFFSESY